MRSLVPGSHLLSGQYVGNGAEHCDKGLCNEGNYWPYRCSCGGLIHHFTYNHDPIEACDQCYWFKVVPD